MRYLFLFLLLICLRVEAVNFSNGTTSVTNARTVELNGVPLTGDSINGSAAYEFSGFSTTTGTVTSIDVAGDNGLTASGGPVTSSGTITVSLDQGQVLVPSAIGTTVQAWDADLDTLATNDGSNLTGVDATTIDGIDSLALLGNGVIAINNGNTLIAVTNGVLQDTTTVVLTPQANLSAYTNDAGFLTGNETITLSGDVSGSGTTSITTTVANDSHAHTASTITLASTDLTDTAGIAYLANTQSFTGNNTFTTGGATDSVVINHTSGAGIGLDIAKAGDGEGLRVVKSSGSGNAVTISGGQLETNNNILMSGETASRAAYFDASKNIKSSTVTSTELGYLSGVTSAIQTQLDGKQASGSYLTAASINQTNNGTSTSLGVTPDSLGGSIFGTKGVEIIVVDYTADTTTGDGKAYFHIPASLTGMNLVTVHAEVITAGTTGTTDIQIHNVTDAQDMLSTKLTIDSGWTGSDTAATPAVINTSFDDVATNDLLRIDVDAVSTTPAQGLIVTLEFQKP